MGLIPFDLLNKQNFLQRKYLRGRITLVLGPKPGSSSSQSGCSFLYTAVHLFAFHPKLRIKIETVQNRTGAASRIKKKKK